MVDDKERGNSQSLEARARSINEEARMVLPGIQALFGFQLIAIFNDRFADLESADRLVHLWALVLIALSIALIMTPAAYHRICEPDRTSEFFSRLASVLVAAAMIPLLLSISLDIYVVTRLALQSGDASVSAMLAAAAFAVFFGLWIGFPYWHRMRAQLEKRRREGVLLTKAF